MPRFEPIITQEAINSRIDALAQEIATHYGSKDVLAVCVLKGAFVFFADLVRALHKHDMNLTVDFVRLASYGRGTSSTGKVEFMKDLETSVEGKEVLIVEDIVDTGQSMEYLLRVFELRKPATVAICSLLDKTERRQVELKVDFAGFALDEGFAVGYGLDFDERYRELPAIYEYIPDGGGDGA